MNLFEIAFPNDFHRFRSTYKWFRMNLLVIIVMLITTIDGCRHDSDCPSYTYCYKSGECAACSNCSIYHRYNGSYCARDVTDCGVCLTGYIEEDNFDGVKSSCVLDRLVQNNHTENSDSNVTLLCAAVVLVFILLSTFVFYKRFRPWALSWVARRIDSNSYPSAPPHESNEPMDYKLNCSYLHNRMNSHENNNTQGANMLNPPCYVGNSPYNNNPPERGGPEREPEHVEPEQVDGSDSDALLNTAMVPTDETTQPSNWMPDNQNETPRVTFENILNPLNELSMNASQGNEQNGNTSSQFDCPPNSQSVVLNVQVNMLQNNYQGNRHNNQNDIGE